MQRVTRGWLRGLSVCLFFASSALADTPRVQLRWQHPLGTMCPSRGALTSDVEQLVGHPIFVSPPAAADIVVTGSVQETAAGARATLEARAADGALLGVRELSAALGDCASLRRPLGLVLTMLIDTPSADLRSRSLPRRRGGGAVGAALAFQTGVLPRVALGVALTGAVELAARVQLRAAAAHWLPVSAQTREGVGARLQATTLALLVCPQLGERDGLRLSLCSGLQLGALLSTPLRLEGPVRQARLLAQLVFALGLRRQLGRASALEASIGPVVSLLRPRSYYLDETRQPVDVHRPAALGAIVQLTLIIQGS